MKKCPYCAEEIQDEAIFCRYCRRDLPAKEPGPDSPPQAQPPAHSEALAVPETPAQSAESAPASVWKSGAKGSAVITVLYVISLFTRPTNEAELAGDLTIGLVATFIVWWLICTLIVWLWRTVGVGFFLLAVIGAILVVLAYSASRPNAISAPATSTSLPTRRPNPTATKLPLPTRPPLVSGCIWSYEIPESSFGEYICVQGVVGKIVGNVENAPTTRIFFKKPLAGILVFTDEAYAGFYIVDETYYYPNLDIGDCVYASGTIRINAEDVFFMRIDGGLESCT